jgi:hypothetical protein
LFDQFENCKTSSIDHRQRLESFEKEKDVFLKKIKSLEDALMHSKLPLEKPCDYDMSNSNTSSSSHAMPIHRIKFVKPGLTTISKCNSSSSTHLNIFKECPVTCHMFGESTIQIPQASI